VCNVEVKTKTIVNKYSRMLDGVGAIIQNESSHSWYSKQRKLILESKIRLVLLIISSVKLNVHQTRKGLYQNEARNCQYGILPVFAE